MLANCLPSLLDTGQNLAIFNLTRCPQDRAKCGKIMANNRPRRAKPLAKTGPNRPNNGQHWPKVGRSWPNPGQSWPNSVDRWQASTNIGRHWVESRRLGELSGNLLDNYRFDQNWVGLGQVKPASAESSWWLRLSEENMAEVGPGYTQIQVVPTKFWGFD